MVSVSSSDRVVMQAKAARAMGYPILAEMLDDADGDGVPNYRDPDYKRSGKPQEMRRPAFAEETEKVAKQVLPTNGQERK